MQILEEESRRLWAAGEEVGTKEGYAVGGGAGWKTGAAIWQLVKWYPSIWGVDLYCTADVGAAR